MRGSLAERFWAKVDKNGPTISAELGPCWVWKGSVTGHFGHGKVCVDGSDHKAHRVAFWLTHGRWPEPCCLHRCDNPPCVNPAHLFEGTQQENMRDKRDKGRQSMGRGHPLAKLSEADIREIRMATGLQREIAVRFGVTQALVSLIRLRKKWAHVA